MPLYNYKCDACETEFELLRKMSDMELALKEPCPSCEKEGEIQMICTYASFGDPIAMGRQKVSSGFGQVLSRIRENHPHGEWGNKKFTPTREI